jgi:hypothetical protein
MPDVTQFEDAARLEVISQRVGFALWQLQELEGIAATYLVLVTRTRQGMGIAAGKALLDQALSKTFGATVNNLTKAQKMPSELEGPVRQLLAERNWLVHGSLASSRSAVRNEAACAALVDRINAICASAKHLMREYGSRAEAFAKSQGVTSEAIDAEAIRTLRKWHGRNAS